MLLERIQEIHEIGFLLIRKSDAESLVIEIHRIPQGRGRTVVEVWRSRREPTQNGALDLADIGALSGDQRASRVGDLEYLAGERPLRAGQGEHGQSGDVERWRAFCACIGDADIERRLDGMIADIGRVVASAAESRKVFDPKRIVDARNARNVDVRRVEHLLAARNRPMVLDIVLVETSRAQPRSVDIENVGRERQAGWIFSEWIVHADEEGLQ